MMSAVAVGGVLCEGGNGVFRVVAEEMVIKTGKKMSFVGLELAKPWRERRETREAV